jgi:thiamine transport system substrate-binding protein
MTNRLLPIVAAATLALAAAGCGDTAPPADDAEAVTITLLTHDSFVVSDELLAGFEEQTGITVELLQGGDAGTVVNQAILTKGNPQADVLFGIDSTFLSRALDEDLFETYESPASATVPADLLLDGTHHVTAVDYGDVCINYDTTWFADHDVPVPTSLGDLTDPAYEDLLVVEDPATSSPGLAFLLATVAAFGEDGWSDYWADLEANGVLAVDGWEQAYYEEFSGASGSKGRRPLVVSYASSPPAEVVYADPPVDEPPTAVIDSTCYRQIEGAGVLAGTKHPEEAGELIDFLLSAGFQESVPLSMFVFPVVPGTPLPDVFTKFAATPADVFSLPADTIAANRDEWIDEWTDLVAR